jgi:hypothetical protein
MTSGEIAAASTVSFEMPAPDDERGLIQPGEPHRVSIPHAQRPLDLPAGLFTLVDVDRSRATRVMATPSLEYLDVPATVDLLHLIEVRANAAGWDAVQTPNYTVLGQELPKRRGDMILGEWDIEGWKAEMRVRAALKPGSEEAKLAGLPGGGFLTTLIVWDPVTLR